MKKLAPDILRADEPERPSTDAGDFNPEELAAYLEGRLKGSALRRVRTRLSESPAARAALAEIVRGVRGADYGRELLEQAAAPARPAPAKPPRPASRWAAWLRAALTPRALAPAAALCLLVAVAVPAWIYARNWETLALERSVRLADRGDLAGARQALSPLLARSKPDSQMRRRAEREMESLYVREGRQLETRGQFDQAERVYEQAARDRGASPPLLTRAAEAKWKASRARRGLPLQRFVSDPRSGGAPRLAPDESRAIEDLLGRALQLDPAYVPALKSLAQTQIDAGQFSDAAQTLETARARAPRDPEVHNGLGQLFADQGQWSEAEAQYQAAIAAQPDNAAAHASLARLFEAQGQPQRAEPHRQRLRELNLEDLFR